MTLELKSAVDESLLDAMVGEIVAEAQPRKVVLFGSQARGKATEKSDIDFMVVCDGPFGPANPRRLLAGRIYRRLRKFGVPKDILLYTPAEVDEWKPYKNHLIARALAEGKVLYERG